MCHSQSKECGEKREQKEEKMEKWHCFTARLPVWMGTCPEREHWVIHSTDAETNYSLVSLLTSYLSSDSLTNTLEKLSTLMLHVRDGQKKVAQSTKRGKQDFFSILNVLEVIKRTFLAITVFDIKYLSQVTMGGAGKVHRQLFHCHFQRRVNLSWESTRFKF